jgi:hypothetical protein
MAPLTAFKFLGSSVLVFSTLRIPMLKQGTTDTDSSWSTVDGILLSYAEPTIGIICACLPVMWPLVRISISVVITKSKTVLGSKVTKSKWSEGRGRHWNALKGEEQYKGPEVDTLQDVEGTYIMESMNGSSQSRRHTWDKYPNMAEHSVEVRGNV